MVEYYHPIWFEASDAPPERRSQVFARAFSGLVGAVEVAFAPRTRIAVRMVHCALPGVLISTCFEGRAQFRFGGAANTSDVMLVRPVGGCLRLRQAGQDVVLAERDAMLLALGTPFECDATQTKRFDFLRLAAPALAQGAASVASGLRAVPAADNRLILLTHYAGALLQGAISLESERHARLSGNHLRELAGTLFGLDEPSGPVPGPAARLAAIKAQIAREFGRQDFSIEVVARAQDVTPRYVQKLFEAEGSTFTRFLLSHRLEAAHAALCQPEHAERSISAIAFDAGFGDLSYFNRSFRQRFGITPSKARRLKLLDSSAI